MKINMNQTCAVIIRERGVKAYNKYFQNLGMDPPKKLKIGDEYKSQLWDIMHIFGDSCCMGPPPPFDTIIEIEEN